jgi:acyl carrier protein
MSEPTDLVEIQERVRQFILSEVLEMDGEAELPPDVPLLSGLLDSFGLISLLTFLEETYGITIEHNEVVDQNFQSVPAVADLVARKRPMLPEA